MCKEWKKHCNEPQVDEKATCMQFTKSSDTPTTKSYSFARLLMQDSYSCYATDQYQGEEGIISF